MSVIPMEDDLGIVYLVQNAQQFWSELEDVLHIPNDDSTTLSRLDSALRRFLSLCASYHEQYLQSPLQLGHACELLLDSELFTFHSERMCEILGEDTRASTDPHFQLILYNVLLFYGRRQLNFFRSSKRWQPIIPLLMDHVLVEIDPDIEDIYSGLGSHSNYAPGSNVPIPIPIEAKLRSLGVRLLYEVCRVQKLSMQDLRIFDDSFIDYLFDLVEQTRNMQDETFNYSVIKLIVSLNEQFMVASLHSNLPPQEQPKDHTQPFESNNRVLRVLMRRLGSSKTFGENMIFMLNRANRSPEDLCMQLLVLKILYLLFTTKGTSEYFYTNDLCVLVDVFLRELVDLDEESESLRHTFLRVLHPLLTKTQLRSIPYKRPQIVQALESLMHNGYIRDINPTTKRLVERCLAGEWCVQFRTNPQDRNTRAQSPSSESVASAAQAQANLEIILGSSMSSSAQLERSGSLTKGKTLKLSKSMEFVKGSAHKPPPRSPVDYIRRPSKSSASSLPGAASNIPPVPHVATQSKRRDMTGVRSAEIDGDFATKSDRHRQAHDDSISQHPQERPPVNTPPSPIHVSSSTSMTSPTILSQVQTQTPHRRSAPPAPGKRRKPPAVPAGRLNGHATITTIKSSASSPLSMITKSSNSKQSML